MSVEDDNKEIINVNDKSIGSRKFHIIVLSILLVVYLLGYILPLGLRDMMRPDEFRYGEIPREMLASGDWTVPLLVGVRYFEKPALGYQWTAFCMQLFGENAFAVRLPAALSVGLAALMIYFICARKQRDRWLAPLAAVIFMSFAIVFGVGTFAVLDSQLSMALCWCLGSYYLCCEAEKLKSKCFFLLLAGVGAGAAFLFKGFLAFAVPVVVITPFLIWQKDWKKFLTTPWLPLIAAVAVALPWSIAVWKAEPGFWDYFFIEEHIKRFTASTYDRDPEPFWFFIPILLGGMLPGGLYWLAAWRGVNKQWLREPLVRYCICWLWMPFLLFSAASCKTGTYILPCFPALAILTAWAVLNMLKSSRESLAMISSRVYLVLGGVLFAGGLLGAAALICWRMLLVEKYPIMDPMDPKPFIGMMLISVFGVIVLCVRKLDFKRSLLILLGSFIVFGGWLAGAFLSKSTNPQKMPEAIIRDIYRQLDVTNDDIIAADRGAATVSAWVLKRTDIKVIGRLGEFNYGFTKYPQEYAQRYYRMDELPRLLQESGNKRVFYAIIRDEDKRAYPEDWKVRRVVSDRGVTVVELDK